MNYELWMRNESGLMKILPRTVVFCLPFVLGDAHPSKPPNPLNPSHNSERVEGARLKTRGALITRRRRS